MAFMFSKHCRGGVQQGSYRLVCSLRFLVFRDTLVRRRRLPLGGVAGGWVECGWTLCGVVAGWKVVVGVELDDDETISPSFIPLVKTVQGCTGRSSKKGSRSCHCRCSLQNCLASKGRLHEDPYFMTIDMFLMHSASATAPSTTPRGAKGLGREGSLMYSRASNS